MPDNDNKPHVLVVDDEWRLGSNIARYLGRQGYQTQAVTSVAAANRAITERQPDFALVDLKLPDISGVDLCRMLHHRFPALPVVVMSARIDPAEKAALEAHGVRGFLTKPFALSAMADKLRELGLRPADADSPAPAPKTVPLPNRPRPRRPGHQGNGPRIVLYSHDTMGLGHMRRNILIARSLAESHLKANVLLVSGAREVGRFELPPGIDCLVLPSYSKSTAGAYQARHLDLATRDLVNLRAHTINVSVGAFEPDVMIVDNVPRGALNELDPVLTTLNARGQTSCVLGLRDVLDAPAVVQREWSDRRNLPAIHWHYDQVWVYGDPAVYNLCDEYDFGDAFAAKARFTGYLDARKRAVPRPDSVPDANQANAIRTPEQPFNLCLVGGGQDGYDLAKAFAESTQPDGTQGVLVSGPFMHADHMHELRQIAAGKPELQVLGFVPEPTLLLAKARRVVTMGGYNTVNEVLAFERPTMIVPRVKPREEQIVRARRLAEMGYVDMLHPDELTAARISDWLADPNGGRITAGQPIDLLGLDRLAGYVEALLEKTELQHASA